MNEIKVWSDFFEKNNIAIDQRAIFLKYIEKLVKNNVPIIFEFNHLACLLGFDTITLASIIFCTDKSYRTFYIPKKRGGVRSIASPYPALHHCQQWLYENILKNIKTSNYSYAYCGGRSIVDNASLHLNSDEILKLDIVDFFGSINIKRVI